MAEVSRVKKANKKKEKVLNHSRKASMGKNCALGTQDQVSRTSMNVLAKIFRI